MSTGTGALAIRDGIFYRACEGEVERVDLETRRALEAIPFGFDALGIAVTPKHVFLFGDNTDVYGYALATAKETHELTAYGAPIFIAYTGKDLYYVIAYPMVMRLGPRSTEPTEIRIKSVEITGAALHETTLVTYSRKQSTIAMWSLPKCTLLRRLRAGRVTAVAATASHVYAVAGRELLSYAAPDYARVVRGKVGAATALVATATHVYAAGPNGVYALDLASDALTRLTDEPGLGLAIDETTVYVETGDQVVTFPVVGHRRDRRR